MKNIAFEDEICNDEFTGTVFVLVFVVSQYDFASTKPVGTLSPAVISL